MLLERNCYTPASGSVDVILTATIAFESESDEKLFTVKILRKILPLIHSYIDTSVAIKTYF